MFLCSLLTLLISFSVRMNTNSLKGEETRETIGERSIKMTLNMANH